MTAEHVQGLRVKLDDLRSELRDAAQQRRTVSEQFRTTDSQARPGLEARLAELDARILAIEKEITVTGAQLRSVPAHLLAATAQPSPDEAARIASQLVDDIVPIVAILSVFVFAPIMIAISRFIWKRSVSAPRHAISDQPTQQRLEQLQQAVDTIAIEVERISEGQRFVTKILSERDRAAIGIGAAEPAHAPRKAALPGERG